MFGAKKQIIGLDIGASSIKIVQLEQSKKGTELKAFGMLPLAPEVIVDGAIILRIAGKSYRAHRAKPAKGPTRAST